MYVSNYTHIHTQKQSLFFNPVPRSNPQSTGSIPIAGTVPSTPLTCPRQLLPLLRS